MSTDERGQTKVIADFAYETTIDDMPAVALEHARLIVLDTVGVMLAAQEFPVGRIITEHVSDLGGKPEARVIGSDVVVSAPMAALANGTLAHGLDFDDHKHLTTHTLSASFAIGQRLGSSGTQILEAYILGREVGATIGSIIEAKRKFKQGPTYRGWYRVGVVGPIASAISAGKLLGLSADQLANAIGIAASSSAGLRRNQGTMAKAMYAGNGASAGVHAALLASRGFTGDQEILEAPLGLVNALCLPGEAEWGPLEKLGNPFDIAGHIGVKKFPACSPAHRPVEAMLQLQAKQHVKAEDVASIEADLHTFSLMRVDPQEDIATGFSLPYLLARALMDETLGLDQVSEERLFDPEVRALMAKVVHDPEAAPSRQREWVTVRLNDGTTLVQEVDDSPDLHEAEPINAKYLLSAGTRLPSDQVLELQAMIADIDSVSDINALVDLTNPRSS